MAGHEASFGLPWDNPALPTNAADEKLARFATLFSSSRKVRRAPRRWLGVGDRDQLGFLRAGRKIAGTAFNVIRAFNKSFASLAPLPISACKCRLSCVLSRTTCCFTSMFFPTMLAFAT